MSNGNVLKVVGGLALTGIGAYGAYKVYDLNRKVTTLCARLNCTMDDLVGKDDISIQQTIVDKATEQAAKEATLKAVQGANDALVKEASKEINTAITAEIDKVKDEIKPMVEESLTKKVADIDIYELRRDVKEAAKKQVVTKLASSYFLD